jgi:hypothetical protein
VIIYIIYVYICICMYILGVAEGHDHRELSLNRVCALENFSGRLLAQDELVPRRTRDVVRGVRLTVACNVLLL